MVSIWRPGCVCHVILDLGVFTRKKEDKKRPCSSSVPQSRLTTSSHLIIYLTSSQFLLSRKERAQHDPSYREPLPDYSVYRPDQYGMHAYPPPVYDPNAPAPPSYQPPAGATKVDPSQSRTGPTGSQPAPGEPSPEYTPPLGPPPAAALHAAHTGSSSASNNPYRQ